MHMIEALRALGIAVTLDEPGCTAELTGCRGHIPESDVDLFCGNSGTTIRFLTAMTALGQGSYRLDGIARMRRRPIGELCDVLQSLGAGIEYHGDEGFPPLTVHAGGLRGGHVAFSSPQSSQMVSALLLAAPYASRDVFIEVAGELPSGPYVRMTTAVMSAFGVEILAGDTPLGAESLRGPKPAARDARFIVEAPRRYEATNVRIEPDASNATYFLAAPAVAGGRVTVRGLGRSSIQGDVGFVAVLEKMGCTVAQAAAETTVIGPAAGQPLHGIDVDLSAMPDTVPTLAAIALFADSPTTIRNVANLRIKESDRLTALATELRRLGAAIDERPDGLTIHPCAKPTSADLDTYNDHRLAMAFALVGMRLPGLRINDPACCAKTFPDFFERFERILPRQTRGR
jgi:3-phosphoshikimate 1-carboxyvinyltransferase